MSMILRVIDAVHKDALSRIQRNPEKKDEIIAETSDKVRRLLDDWNEPYGKHLLTERNVYDLQTGIASADLSA